MSTNLNLSGGAQPSDLLSAIYKVEVRNEEKISAVDRAFCERQQAVLYRTLEQIERCYAVLRAEAERYNDLFKIICEPNGRIDVKFKDAAAAEACFRRLRLHELRLHNDND